MSAAGHFGGHLRSKSSRVLGASASVEQGGLGRPFVHTWARPHLHSATNRRHLAHRHRYSFPNFSPGSEAYIIVFFFKTLLIYLREVGLRETEGRVLEPGSGEGGEGKGETEQPPCGAWQVK